MPIPGMIQGAGPGATPPTGPSAITPGVQSGVKAQAMIKVKQAAMLLAESVGILKTEVGSDLGKAVMASLKTLAPFAPGVQEGLGQSELASMQQGLQAVRPAPPMAGTAKPSPMMMGKPMGGMMPPPAGR